MTGDSGQPMTRRRTLAVLGAAAVAGCSTTSGDAPTTGRAATTGTPTRTTPTPEPGLSDRYDVAVEHTAVEGDADWTAPTSAPAVETLETETLIENLEVPWDLSFAPDGTLFVTERVGRVLAFDGEETRVVGQPADVIDAEAVEAGKFHKSWWVEGGEGGVLGIAAHPTYPDPPLVYVYYTASTDDGKRNRVVALDVEAGEQAGVVVDDIPANTVHNGGRITFGPRNYLWVTCGDAAQAAKAQDTATLHGTVLRVTPDGDPAPGNPDLGADCDPRIYTYGHRNPQGIVWLPDGTTLVTEHGPDGRDELNRLAAGANYSWPEVYRRAEYPGSSFHKPLANSGKPSWAPTGAQFYTGEAVPTLSNRLLVGGLYSQQLLVATVTPPDGTLPPVGDGTRYDQAWTDDAYTVTTHTALENDLGRIRHVEQSPSDDIYLVTSNRDGRAKKPFPREQDDVLVRLTTA